MNTQGKLIKLLLLTITAGFASAETIQEPIAEADQTIAPIQFDNVAEEFSVAKIEMYSGENLYDQLIRSALWGPTFQLALDLPKDEAIKFFDDGDNKHLRWFRSEWSDDYKSKVDNEEFGFKKFFNESDYCSKEVADKANYELNYCLTEIRDSLTEVKTLELEKELDHKSKGSGRDAYECLNTLRQGLWRIELQIRDVEDKAESPVPFEVYKAIIPTITPPDLDVIGMVGQEECRFDQLGNSIRKGVKLLTNISTLGIL